MVDTKKILIFTIILFVSSGCKKSPTAVATATTDLSTLNNPDLGNDDLRTIEDYWYNFEEAVESQFLYHNYYITGGSNTIGSPTSLNPYRDTLLFRTFPGYTVEVDNGGTPPYDSTISYMLSLTESNYVQHSTLYQLDETNTDGWCKELLVEYDGNCPGALDVNFDYQILSVDPLSTQQDIDTSQAYYENVISTKKAIFTESWVDIAALTWDNDLQRYSIVPDSIGQVMKATLCAGICDTNATIKYISADSLNENYDSTLVIRKLEDFYDEFAPHEIDGFDSTVYIGIIDTNRYAVKDLMLIDRTEWQRFDSTYQTLKRYRMDTTFVYDRITIPDNSPMYWINGDCNQNLVADIAEVYFDYGEDWCPDSRETGEGRCTVVDTNGNGLSDEEPCHCVPLGEISPVYVAGFCSNGLLTSESACGLDLTQCSNGLSTSESACGLDPAQCSSSNELLTSESACGLDPAQCSSSNELLTSESACILDPAQCFDGISTSAEDCAGWWVPNSWTANTWTANIWAANTWTPPNDPNGDRWRDCGSDQDCPGDPDYPMHSDFNGTESNGYWDPYERTEGNGKYDIDVNTKQGERFFDLGNGVVDNAEFCKNFSTDGACLGPFEDRNCNGKWDAHESVDCTADDCDKGNGIWDDKEAFIDSSGEGVWDAGEPIHSIGDRLGRFLVDYSDPLNPTPITTLDSNTTVTLFYGTIAGASEYVTYNKFIERQEKAEHHSQRYYDIEDIVTIYTNKIMENEMPGNVGQYDIVKTKWYQDTVRTHYDEKDLDTPNYGYDYGYDYHFFKDEIAENGRINKLVHPAYFYYYGYYNDVDEWEINSWRDELEDEIYIYTYDGLLRSGESVYTEETIVTDVADYYVENLYEVSYDSSVDIPFKKVRYYVLGCMDDGYCIANDPTEAEELAGYHNCGFPSPDPGQAACNYDPDATKETSTCFYSDMPCEDVDGDQICDDCISAAPAGYIWNIPPDTTCIDDIFINPVKKWLNDVNVDSDWVEENYMQRCPPMDTTLTNAFKITRTKTITMIGTGVEFGLRNTIWLGSAGENQPLGIVKDQLEGRWSEPFYQEYGSGWATMSCVYLRSFRKSESESSGLLRLFQPIKRLSLNQLVGQEKFDNEPYVAKRSYGIHKLRSPNEK